MVMQQDMYPVFPIMKCQVCGEHFEVPRKWLEFGTYGKQIIMDWEAANTLLKFHLQTHYDTLANEAEEFLRANT